MLFVKLKNSSVFQTGTFDPSFRKSSLKAQFIKLIIILFIILTFHTLAMIHLEGMSTGDALWLTMTSATTVGYGDLSAQTTLGRFATVILLYIGGIATLAQAATMYFEYRQESLSRMLKGDWSWKMENHLVFIGCPQDIGEEFYYQAISGLRKSKASLGNLPIVIVSQQLKNGISDRLRKLDVVHVSKCISDSETLDATSIRKANTVIILAKDQIDPLSDSLNFELIDRLRENGVTARIIVESVKDSNRIRLKKVGADSVLRPLRSYPELLMRSILAKGSEKVIETLFDSIENECIRYDVNIKSLWFDIVHKLSLNDLGIPIAYENSDGEIVNNPSSKEQVNATAIFVFANQERVKKNSEVYKILNTES